MSNHYNGPTTGVDRVAWLRHDCVLALCEVIENDNIFGYTVEDAIKDVHDVSTDDTGKTAWVSFHLNVATQVVEILKRLGYTARDTGHSNVEVTW